MFGRALQPGAIWLTAMMTLIAGTPHLVCRCPNGKVKPFCLSLFSGKTSCCGNSCCSASQVDDGKGSAARVSLSATLIEKSCCRCKAHQEDAREESRTDTKLGKERCQKTLVEGIVAVPAPSVEAPVQDLTTHLFVPAPETSMAQEGFGACDSSFANHYHWPPPTDLVTVFQHLLI